MLRLQEYDFTISHVPGEQNVLPDMSSRTNAVDLPEIAYGVNALEQDAARLVQIQRSDDTLKTVIQVITNKKNVESTHSEP
ncbi:unnamed protein product [Trichobilharzia regenti]|nr:unnamed protein product [Trichobilharzia regenti]